MDIKPEEKKKLFSKIQEIFAYNARGLDGSDANVCCSEDEQTALMQMAEKLHAIPTDSDAHPWRRHLAMGQIYIVMLFVYYALVANEQTTDRLKTGALKRLTYSYPYLEPKKEFSHFNIILYTSIDTLSQYPPSKSKSPYPLVSQRAADAANTLFFEITTGDLVHNGENISRGIRSHLFFGDAAGANSFRDSPDSQQTQRLHQTLCIPLDKRLKSALPLPQSSRGRSSKHSSKSPLRKSQRGGRSKSSLRKSPLRKSSLRKSPLRKKYKKKNKSCKH